MTSRHLKGERRFEFIRQLSDTLQGRVYSARDKTSNNHVVVKETWKQLMKLKKSRSGHIVHEDIEKEIQTIKYLSEQTDAPPTFVRFIDEWEDDNCYLFAMEMCKGSELFDYIQSKHSDSPHSIHAPHVKQQEMQTPNEWMTSIRDIFRQMAACTAWMHSKGVCHLDLSLENVMIHSMTKQTIKIIDFGASQFYPNGIFLDNKRIGKIPYMAPEVLTMQKYDARSADIWSLGIMLFMMLVGAPPFAKACSSIAAFKYIVNGRLRDVLKQWKRLQCVNEDALDLLSNIFKYEKDRITMDEILKHPFVRQKEHTNKQ